MKAIYRITLAIACAAFTSCGQKQEPKEKYCGKEISAFEVMDLKNLSTEYKYNDADNKLALDVQDTLTRMFAAKKTEVKVGTIVHDKDRIGFFIVVPDDKEVIERSSCFLLQNDMGGRMPKTRKLLFYAKDQNTILAAITNKE